MISPNPEVNGCPSSLYCPACWERLWMKWNGERVVVYCVYGPCEDSRMNDGAEGDTIEEAYAALVKLEQEPRHD